MNSYQLTRKWFDFVGNNPDKVKPQHLAIYMLAIEHCNRLGWSKEFAFPSSYAMNYTGIATYKTYIKALNDLIEFGFIRMVKKTRNQFSSNIIALVFNENDFEKSSKAIDRAIFNANSDLSPELCQSKTEAEPKQDQSKTKAEPKQNQSRCNAHESFGRKEVLESIKTFLSVCSQENKDALFNQILNLEDFKSYLWQNFETFQSSARSEIQAEPDFDLCQSIFKEAAPSYVWFDEDNKHLKSLVQKIQSSIKQTQSKVSVDETFRFMLDNLPDWWRNKKFTLANLNNNYNEIINEIQQSNGKDQSNTAQELDQYAQNFGK
jgi:hypothetical protein